MSLPDELIRLIKAEVARQITHADRLSIGGIDGKGGNTVITSNGDLLLRTLGGHKAYYNGTEIGTISGTITGSGTTNYLAKFTGASAIGNSVLKEVGGEVFSEGNLTLYKSGGSNYVLKFQHPTEGSGAKAWMTLFTGYSNWDFLINSTGRMQLQATDGIVFYSPIVGGFSTTGTIAMGSNKITGLAAGTVAGDAVRYEQILTAGEAISIVPSSSSLIPAQSWIFNSATYKSAIRSYFSAASVTGDTTRIFGIASEIDASAKVKGGIWNGDTVGIFSGVQSGGADKVNIWGYNSVVRNAAGFDGFIQGYECDVNQEINGISSAFKAVGISIASGGTYGGGVGMSVSCSNPNGSPNNRWAIGISLPDLYTIAAMHLLNNNIVLWSSTQEGAAGAYITGAGQIIYVQSTTTPTYLSTLSGGLYVKPAAGATLVLQSLYPPFGGAATGIGILSSHLIFTDEYGLDFRGDGIHRICYNLTNNQMLLTTYNRFDFVTTITSGATRFQITNSLVSSYLDMKIDKINAVLSVPYDFYIRNLSNSQYLLLQTGATPVTRLTIADSYLDSTVSMFFRNTLVIANNAYNGGGCYITNDASGVMELHTVGKLKVVVT